MKQPQLEQEMFLEMGLVVLGALLIVGLGLWLFGHTKGAAQHAVRRAQGPPAPGSVSPERHRNIAATSTR